MKKTVLALLTGVLLLSAVEWDIEQVTTGHPDDAPAIALDDSGNVGIAIYRYSMEGYDSLMFASNASGFWDVTFVDSLLGWYSLDFDSKGNAYIAYTNADHSTDSMDIYLATDSSGEFEIHNLTNNPAYRYTTSVKLDSDDNLHLLYHEQIGQEPGETHQLYYGWFNGEGFHSELVTDSLYTSWTFDLVVDPDNNPHAFYSGMTGGIWHATRPSVSSFPQWDLEQIYEGYAPWDLSADVDKNGNFHLGFGGWIYHLSNRTGSWEKVWAADTSVGEDIYGEYPSIAVDPVNFPHIAWLRIDESSAQIKLDLYYSGETTQGWLQEPITTTPDIEEFTAEKHFFAIDAEGYGHIVYSELDEYEEIADVYHAKSTEPLTGSSIAERPAASNPFNLEVHGSSVHFSLPEQGSISVNLYDACGRRVQCLASGTFTAGEHTVPINSTELAAGVYFIRAEIAERSANAKFVLTR